MTEKKPSRCPSCGSRRSASRGYRLSSQGKSNDRECKNPNCGRRYLVKMNRTK